MKRPVNSSHRFGRRPHKSPGLPKRREAVRVHDGAPLQAAGQQVPEGPPQLQGGLLQAWLPDGYSQIFRSYVFGPSGFWIMALLRYAAKFDPFLSLDNARVEGKFCSVA